MSFLGGAECSTAANPLAQVSKHAQDDKSLQRDRLVGRGPGGLHESIRTQGTLGMHDKSMEAFLQEPGQMAPGPAATPFAMEQMRRELDGYQSGPHRSQIHTPSWAKEFQPHSEESQMGASFLSSKSPGFSPADFARYQQLNQPGADRAASPMSYGAVSPGIAQRPMGLNYGMGMGMGMGGMGIGLGMGVGMGNQSLYAPMQSQGLSRAAVTEKGKGRMVELDETNWEAQFAEIDKAGQRDLDVEANDAIERELSDLDRSVLNETDDFGDFESLWKGIQAENATRHIAANDSLLQEGFEHNFDIDGFSHWDGLDRAFTRDPQLGDYLFEEDNAYRDSNDATNPFNEGVRIMQEGGNLSLAALAFEAAVQKDPSHVEAWTYLGSAQAQNEKETPAIRALEQALKLDPSNLTALMGLAVSYTNEGYDSTAYRTLERWLAVKYPELVGPYTITPDADVGFTERHVLHQKVSDLFIKAAQQSPAGEQMDPDVQVGLGVLFYGSEDYDKAVDCFSAALASTESGTSNQLEQVHLLWNRLGATLANSGRSEEAIAAYEKALTLRPNFVRARYNLGVSCINIGCFTEAAQHLLGALQMHAQVMREGQERLKEVVGEGVSEGELERLVSQNQSTNLYDTLRRVFSQMGRRDLSERVVPGMDVETFRGEFDF